MMMKAEFWRNLALALALVMAGLLPCGNAVAAEPTSADLEHGKRQVERMLADHPGMAVYRREKDNKAGYVEEGDAIYRWAVEAYAGRYVGERVYWVNGDTEGAQNLFG
jgi:hypothetical protein